MHVNSRVVFVLTLSRLSLALVYVLIGSGAIRANCLGTTSSDAYDACMDLDSGQWLHSQSINVSYVSQHWPLFYLSDESRN